MTDAEILAKAKAEMVLTNPLIVLNETDFKEIQSSGVSLRTAKAKDLQNGIYTIVELKDLEIKTKSQVVESLIEYYGEEPKWSNNLPEANINGFCKLKTGGNNVNVYLNNSLFNLMLENGALARDESGRVSLTGQPFKI